MVLMNFTTPISDKDMELFFGPFDEGDHFIIIESHWTMANIMHQAGIFKSVSQARKNGWNKPIPKGFNIFTVGKKRKEIFIFNEKKLDKR
jgi:hypothetical protein